MKGNSGIQILLVEADAMIGMLIEDMLGGIGCKNIEPVAWVDDALKFLAGSRPDFAILDVNLNDAWGYPVAELLKSRKIPIVLVSGYGARGLNAAYAGAKVLQKPFRLGDLDKALAAEPGGTEGLEMSSGQELVSNAMTPPPSSFGKLSNYC